MPPDHVPAWKRLGLKLKFANQDADQNIITNSSQEDLNGTVGKPHSSSPVSSSKKRKRHEASEKSTARSLEQDSLPDASTASAAGSKLKKSVSFTNDTKTSDGNSSKTLIEAYDEKHRLEDEAFRMYSDSITSDTKAETAPSAVDKPATKHHIAAPGQKYKDALDYLNQFHQQRATWKFNKSRDVWILKHALSFKHISVDYEVALLEYVAGLTSEGAKQRLRIQCERVLNLRSGNSTHHERRDRIDGIEDPHSTSQESSTETTNSPDSTPEIARARARKLLQHLLKGIGLLGETGKGRHGSGLPNGSASTLAVAEPRNASSDAPVKPKKKKKPRTTVVEDSDSTSSSSSSSSSDKSE